ncbi:unnamed protein product, partial [Oikopleura dioica]
KMLRQSKLYRPLINLVRKSSDSLASSIMPVIALGGVGAGVYYASKAILHDKYYGQSAAVEVMKDVAFLNDDLDIKLDSPKIAFSDINELVDYYRNNREPRRAFDPPLSKYQEKGVEFCRSQFYVKGPNDCSSGRKVAQIYAETKMTEDGPAIYYAQADIFDIESVIKGSPRQVSKPILIADNRPVEKSDE